ncbi:hypothetical protein EVA_13275 [gut metagenome]|uniref:Uncharacterized protein n=1 Tax=gut metagenome TaxID=749906 RepID=J9FVS6_9ZZZZ
MKNENEEKNEHLCETDVVPSDRRGGGGMPWNGVGHGIFSASRNRDGRDHRFGTQPAFSPDDSSHSCPDPWWGVYLKPDEKTGK